MIVDIVVAGGSVGAALAISGFALGLWKGRTFAQRIGQISAIAAIVCVLLGTIVDLPGVGSLLGYLRLLGLALLALALGLVCCWRIKSRFFGALTAAAIPFLLLAVVTSI